jgi:hypothetical protein
MVICCGSALNTSLSERRGDREMKICGKETIKVRIRKREFESYKKGDVVNTLEDSITKVWLRKGYIEKVEEEVVKNADFA